MEQDVLTFHKATATWREQLTTDEAVDLPHQPAGLEEELPGVSLRVSVLLQPAGQTSWITSGGERGRGQLVVEIPLHVIQLTQVLPRNRMYTVLVYLCYVNNCI